MYTVVPLIIDVVTVRRGGTKLAERLAMTLGGRGGVGTGDGVIGLVMLPEMLVLLLVVVLVLVVFVVVLVPVVLVVVLVLVVLVVVLVVGTAWNLLKSRSTVKAYSSNISKSCSSSCPVRTLRRTASSSV